MTVKTIFLVRHGQYDLSVPHEIGELGGNLTDLGRKQAGFVASYFAQIPISKIHASSMPRASETARIIATNLELDVLEYDILHEKIPSIPPSIEEEMKIFMEKYPQFSFTTLDEHLRQSEMAFETFFKAPKIDSESSYELLVCHGNLIRFFICKALLIDIDTWIKLEMNHCGISIVNINDSGNMQLVSHNETKHIPSSMVSV